MKIERQYNSNSCFYYKNNKTGDFCAVQSDGSQIMFNIEKRAIFNPLNLQVFNGENQIKNFEKNIKSRNHLEEIEPDEFLKKLDECFNLIISISSRLYIPSELKRREIMSNIDVTNKNYF